MDTLFILRFDIIIYYSVGGIGMKKIVKRIFVFFMIIVLLGAVSVYFINKDVKNLGNKYIMNKKEVPKCDAILVLGAYVKPNGQLCEMLEDRVKYGIDLYNAGKAPKLLLSGDHGTVNYDEVNAMKKVVEKNNIKEEDIFLDHAGFSTYDSIYRAKEIFKVKKVIIVTQDYHLKRAVFIARKLGLEAYGVSSDPRKYFGIERYEAREILARVKDFFNANYIKPKSKLLGDPIPITGDGTATHDKQ